MNGTKDVALVPVVTLDQLELVKKTVATGATADELKLYLYDCARQGVHPLDKLIHFTKRSGKYTPITSIDFMRIRAAETGEYAGSDDAVFQLGAPEYPVEATVTVWRLVQGTRYPFTATARWSEYKPDANDFMWTKMPHTMLGKCAEALALRKGFPKQLAGLYAHEEMDQAVPTPGTPVVVVEAAPDVPEPSLLSAGALLIRQVEPGTTKTGKRYWRYTLSTGAVVKDWTERRAGLAEQCAQLKTPVRIETKETKWGEDVTSLVTVQDVEPEIHLRQDEPPAAEYDGPF